MEQLETLTGYAPGLLGRITELHAKYYAQHWQFGQFFETKVATDMAAFLERYDPVLDCTWSIKVGERIEGSITVDGSSEADGVAHLR